LKFGGALREVAHHAHGYGRQRILQEDLEIISAWFTLVEDTKAKYSVYNNNMHNFNKTSF
jgi:hypothetical protein